MVSPKDSTCENQTGYSTKTSSYQSTDLCVLWEQSIILHLWGFLCIRDAGCRSNKITVMKFQQLCGSRKYPYNPHRRDLLYNPPPPLWIFQIRPLKCTPLPPLWNFQNFHTPPGIIAISYWSEQIRLQVVPHFSSGIVKRAKREHAWKSPHARKGDTRQGERKMRDYRQSPSFWTNALLSQRKTLIGSSMEICQHLSKTRQPLSTLDIITIYRTNN